LSLVRLKPDTTYSTWKQESPQPIEPIVVWDLVAVRGFDSSRNPILAVGVDFDGAVRLVA
jgi:hypothetical protein